MEKVGNRYINPLTLDDDSGGPGWPQRHHSMGPKGTSPGSTRGGGGHTMALPSEALSPLCYATGVEGGRWMAGRSSQPRTSGFRGTARGVSSSSVGDEEDRLDVNTSSASRSTTSPQWRRHNPYRALSSATSTTTQSPCSGDSGTSLTTLPGSLTGLGSSASRRAPQHVSVILHPRACRGTAVSPSKCDVSHRPQQAASHLPDHLHHTSATPNTFQVGPGLSRASSAASRASSHYSCGNRPPSSAGCLPDVVDVVAGSTPSSGAFLMNNCRFRMNSYRQSVAASSSATTPRFYATPDHYFEETGGFAVEDDDAGATPGCDIRQRLTASRSSADEVDHHRRSFSDVRGYGTAGAASLLVGSAARDPLCSRVCTLSTIVPDGGAPFGGSHACGPDPMPPVGVPHTADGDTNSGHVWALPPQRSLRPANARSTISLITATKHSLHQDLSGVEANGGGDLPITPPNMDPGLMPLDSPEVAAVYHSHMNAYPPQQSISLHKWSSEPAAASPPAAAPTATLGFTVAQLTEMLEAHLARAPHGGDGGAAETSDEVRCPAGSQFSVYDSGMRQHYLINSEQVAVTRGAIKYVALNERYGNQTRFRFQLCNRYLHHRCTSAAECQYIHSLVVSTATQVHMNENSITTCGVRQMNPYELAGGRNTLDYSTIAAGIIFAVYPPNQLNSPPQFILSEHILQTEGAVQAYGAVVGGAAAAAAAGGGGAAAGGGGGGGATAGNESTIVRPRHCAHFQFKRMCNLGTSCHFIHSLIPFVQGIVNQPPLPPNVELNTLKTSVYGFVLRPGGIGGSGGSSSSNKRVCQRGGRAQVTEIQVPPSLSAEGIPSVWPHVVGGSQEAIPYPRMNGFYRPESNLAQGSSWLVPQNVNSAPVYAAGVPSYPMMLPMGSVESAARPTSTKPYSHGKRHGALLGFGTSAKAMNELPVKQEPPPLFVGIPSTVSPQSETQALLPPHHYLRQGWGTVAPAPFPNSGVSLQTQNTAAPIL
ncbi:hypothetical protein JKF63_07557 [Porcisia hertigi]|uniref:C3H1-type domain-containing protein n=1 Tax=Porcisia hertigi TaxID=2761500 RepID=A0A836LMG8_9TRYP|nr:hypothetical protein JKF63_07557 [Porcisia hertigi]